MMSQGFLAVLKNCINRTTRQHSASSVRTLPGDISACCAFCGVNFWSAGLRIFM